MNFYDGPSGALAVNGELRQGDIVEPIPFGHISLEAANVLLPGNPVFEQVNLGEPSFSVDKISGDMVAIPVLWSAGIILNQSCDLAKHGKPISVAQVVPCAERIKNWEESDVRRRAKLIADLSNVAKTPSLFYLPIPELEAPVMRRSVADLRTIMTFSADSRSALCMRVRSRLSEIARQAFQGRLTYFFGRFGGPDELWFDDKEWAERAKREGAQE